MVVVDLEAAWPVRDHIPLEQGLRQYPDYDSAILACESETIFH